MPSKQIVFALVTFLHDLFTAVWIGGMFTMGLALLPAARQALGKGPQLRALIEAVHRRLRRLVHVSMLGLLVTGMLLSNRSPLFQGLFQFGNRYSAVLGVKHLLVVALTAISLYRSRLLQKMVDRPSEGQDRQSAVLLLANIVIAVAILLLSGLSAALSAAPPMP